LNSIAQTLTESLDLSDSLHRTLGQMAELFNLDATSLYLFRSGGHAVRRSRRSGIVRTSQGASVRPREAGVDAAHQGRARDISSAQGLPLPPIFREAQAKEEIVVPYIVFCGPKTVSSGAWLLPAARRASFLRPTLKLAYRRRQPDFQRIERSILYEETRQAYENLRRTQEAVCSTARSWPRSGS